MAIANGSAGIGMTPAQAAELAAINSGVKETVVTDLLSGAPVLISPVTLSSITDFEVYDSTGASIEVGANLSGGILTLETCVDLFAVQVCIEGDL